MVELGGVDLERAEAFRDRGERLASRQRGDRGPEGVLRAGFELRVRRFERFAVRLGVGEDLLFRRERRLFVGLVDRGLVDLLQLVAEQIDLAHA